MAAMASFCDGAMNSAPLRLCVKCDGCDGFKNCDGLVAPSWSFVLFVFQLAMLRWCCPAMAAMAAMDLRLC
jgi:hypothetical protein